MTTDRCRETLRERVPEIRILVSEASLLTGIANEIREMVLAYQSDGYDFECRGDAVNACASYAYALGWLDAGCSIGIISAGNPDRGWFVSAPHSPDHGDIRLGEKTARYRKLLRTACDAALPAPDQGSLLLSGSEKIVLTGRTFLLFGETAMGEHREWAALSCFSYGFGWLDAGIRAGFLTARKNRDIFSI
jgi:hypothetical protein